jgi:hypothetical protein
MFSHSASQPISRAKRVAHTNRAITNDSNRVIDPELPVNFLWLDRSEAWSAKVSISGSASL